MSNPFVRPKRTAAMEPKWGSHTLSNMATVRVNDARSAGAKITIDGYCFTPENLRMLAGYLNELADVMEANE